MAGSAISHTDDLVKANDYEVIDKFHMRSGQSDFAALGIDIRNETTPLIKNSAEGPEWVMNFMLNYVIRKKVDAPFYVGLEIATTHAALSQEAAAAYGERRRLAVSGVIRAQTLDDTEGRLKEATQRVKELENSTSWKITRPLRAAKKMLSRDQYAGSIQRILGMKRPDTRPCRAQRQTTHQGGKFERSVYSSCSYTDAALTNGFLMFQMISWPCGLKPAALNAATTSGAVMDMTYSLSH